MELANSTWAIIYIGSLVIFGIIMFGVLSIHTLVPWAAHILSTKYEVFTHVWGSYALFKSKANKCKWVIDPYAKNCLTTKDYKSKLHASIYRFSGVCMIMRTPLDYLLAELYIRMHYKKLLRRQL